MLACGEVRASGGMEGETMSMDQSEEKRLKQIARQMRIDIIETLHNVKTGHPGGS